MFPNLCCLRSALSGIAVSSLVAAAHGQVLAPVFTPVAADSPVAMKVTVTAPTPGSVIRYTLNKQDPTIHDPVIASGGEITISRTAELRARAWVGFSSSAVTVEDYRITGAVSSGYHHGLALSVAGRVWSWGQQGGGRLGNGQTATAEIATPDRVQQPPVNFENGAVIAAGYDHSLVIDQAGALWSFGTNASGQLGNNSTTNSAVPVRVLKSATAGDFIGTTVQVEGGEAFSLALLATGEPVSWGAHTNGRLGNGSSSSTSTRKFAGPVLRGDDPGYPALTGIRGISAGYAHGLAREPNASEVPAATGRVWVWGRNTRGQLGRGNTTSITRAQPMLLDATTELTDALDVSASGSHSVVVRWKDGDPALDGTVWSCGNQQEGRLGNEWGHNEWGQSPPNHI